MRRKLTLAAVGLLLLAAALLAVRESLRHGPLAAEVEARLSAALGQPVTIGAIGVSFFPRLAVTGRDVRVGAQDAAAPGLEIGRVRILPRLRTLFSRPILVEEVRIDGLVVALLRDADGRWHAPAAAPAPGATGDGRAVIERLRLADSRIVVFDAAAGRHAPQETASVDDLEADVTVEDGQLLFTNVQGRAGRARLSGDAQADAEVVRLQMALDEVRDDDLSVLLALAGGSRPDAVRLESPARVSADVRVNRASLRLTGEGRVHAPDVRVATLQLDGLESPFRLDGARLTFAPLTFAMHGGRHEGTLAIVLDRAAGRWTADSRVRDLDVQAFLLALSGRREPVEGRATVSASVGGRVDQPIDTGMAGRASIVVTDGVLRDFPLAAAVTSALRLGDASGSDTRFDRLSGTFTLGNARATTGDLALDAGHVRARLAGTIGFDRALDLRGTAVISAERTAAAVASIRELARLTRGGEIQVPLVISGTADAPEFQVDVAAVLQRGVEDELRRRLLDLFKKRGG